MAGDLRLAVRNLLRARAFALAAALTLALGIGATTTIFSVVYGVLLRPLPYPDPQALVTVQAEAAFPSGVRTLDFSATEIETIVDGSHSFLSLGAIGSSSAAMRTGNGLEALSAVNVSKDTFATLGRPMLLGRALGDDTDPVVVISYRLWQRVFGGSAGVVGRSITISTREGERPYNYTIVGVAPPDFQYPYERTDLWKPVGFARTVNEFQIDNRNAGGVFFIGRLRPGATVQSATEDIDRIIDGFRSTLNETRRGSRAKVVRLVDQAAGTIGPVLLLLFGAVGLLLLIACANVANLILARQASRSREIAVRVAMGAPRGRLIRQLLCETCVVAGLGTGLGAAIGVGGVWVLQYLKPSFVPRLDAVHVDGPVLVFALIEGFAVALLSGLLPAIVTTRTDVSLVMRGNARNDSGSMRTTRLRSVLVVSEIAISIVLLVGATLLARSLTELLSADLGVARDHLLVADLNIGSGARFAGPRQVEMAEALAIRMAALPGVQSAAYGRGLPPAGEFVRVSFELSNSANPGGVSHMVTVVPASPGFFSTLGIPLLRGRTFTPSDAADAPRVVVINRDAARRFFGDQDPIGQGLPILAPPEELKKSLTTVVGVVGNVKFTGIAKPDEATIYAPFAQLPSRAVFLVARTRGDPVAIAGDVRRIVHDYDGDINISALQSLDAWVSDSVALPRFRTLLLSTIAIIAFALAVIGLYGVIAYSVAQRTIEIGIRVALGAKPRDVNRLVIGEGLRLAGLGTVIGLAGAFALRQTLASVLYAVQPADPASFAAAAAALLFVALVACYVPSRRATRVDPVVALREQ